MSRCAAPVCVVQRLDCRLVLVLEYEVGVAFVLEDRDSVLGAQFEHPVAALHAHHGAVGILQSRNRVDILGLHALAPQVFEYLFQMVHTNAVVVQLDCDIVDIAASQEIQRAGEAELFDDYGIALFQQDIVDYLDALSEPEVIRTSSTVISMPR